VGHDISDPHPRIQEASLWVSDHRTIEYVPVPHAGGFPWAEETTINPWTHE